MEIYNIFSQTENDLKDFFTKKIKVGSAIINGTEQGGYDYSQWELLQSIEYMDASKFLTGDRDSEGQQKFYLNIASFRKEVASKNIDIDLKNFNFIPEEAQAEYGALISRKKFKKWAKDNGLSEMLNDSVDRFPKYGSLVMKTTGKQIEIIPLLKLRNSQDAKSLADADYVMIEHTMNRHELEEKKGWKIDKIDLKVNDKITVYERYSYVPKDLNEDSGKEVKTDGKDLVYKMVILTLDKAVGGGGAILFAEEVENPFVEIHYAKQDGRWLGIGEMEKQIENQAARNMVFNLRKKSLAWSAKNIFQTQDDTIVNNLVREVKDGDIMKVSTQNGIYRVDTANRASGDFNSTDTLLEENSNQRSFTFEGSSGQSFKSGTPLGLGAIVSESVMKYYDKKKEQLGIFWKNVIEEFMLDSWIKETEEEFVEGVLDTEEGFDELREAKKNYLIGKTIIQNILADKDVDIEAIKSDIDKKLSKVSRDYYKMTRDEIKNLKYRFDLDITGESVDIPRKMEAYNLLYQSQLKAGQIEDAKITLKKMMIVSGENVPKAITQPNVAMAGMQGQPMPQAQQTQPVNPME